MKSFKPFLLVLSSFIIFSSNYTFAQNPVIRNQFTADPAARVFNDTVYLYTSHDILANKNRGRVGWFCMEDYHVFSSTNLTDWTDHGVIVSQDKVPWVNSKAYAMWAPDCIYKNGKYYLYFPAPAKGTGFRRGFSIGVAVSNTPYGHFTPQPEPIKGVHGIDPNILISKSGQAYLIWAARNFYISKLKENMLELASEPQIIQGLPEKGLKEGPFMFERKGIYYLTYPHVQDTTERLEYAVSNNPMGPFKIKGVIMDATPDCWTNQNSVIKYKGQWYLFYHHNDLSPHFDKNRSVRMDSLFFNEDGTIKKVIPTLRGVGITNASRQIQIDRYSEKNDDGVSIAFLDTSNTFGGWEAILDKPNAWIKYNSVDFSSPRIKSIDVKALSKTGGTLQIRLDKVDGPIIATVSIPKSNEWRVINSSLSRFEAGIHNLIIQLKNNDNVEIDWVKSQ